MRRSLPENDENGALFNATQRLLDAVDRLDSSLSQVSVQAARDVQQQQQLQLFERENSALRQQQQELMSSLAKLQEQYEELKRVATAIYGKLESAINRITKIVDNNA